MIMRIGILLLCSTLSISSLAEEKIKIGVSTALTGNAASYGTDLKNVFLFANEKLAHNAYDLIFDDDKCTGRDAVIVAHRFVDALKLRYVAGFACSGTALSTAPIYEKAKVLVMISSASAADISHAGDYIFRTWASDAGASKKLFNYIAAHHQKIGILSEQTDYAQGFLRSFTDNNSLSDLEILNENYLTEMPDYRSVLLKLRTKGVTALFINSQTDTTFLAVLKQLKDTGWTPQIYTAYWGGSSMILEKAKNLVEGSIFVDLPGTNEVLSSEGKSLFEEYKTKYGNMKSIDLLFGTTFEAFRALHQAIQSGKEPREFLYHNTFHGVFGDWSFDSNGDIQGLDFVIKKVSHGVVTTIE